ncbi:hypothetical protein J2Y45_002998 [Dyadobacter sp. BE34]|uniref:DUF5777 domain-containing protein n=1 Tax=Dyadobacter fermentans TaxID=94254 RepID=A0ABU1QU59_9BACT|nr:MULTISPECIES: DUF5777 family beta-barrel protein [Dyadobacter]MDR6804694.1 hypothetical protein [Dyadobacter fermentans]MDR7043547.1 hypothetical protein [Dyadobacter sp. BE242]MDR7197859.1 hypothetical protein [Dyadobacter sp. BE34]MDR7214708.1 hypothetical protein [Dyadobacter sp. BE31]MDR7262243.1 hypothetical protein [Dyadobacter sp. BE32]
MLKTTFVLFFSLITSVAMAQTDLMKQLEQADDSTVHYAAAIFKGTRIINGHSVETVGKNNMDFIISHRFGAINSGAGNFFGLDESQIRLALEYGLTDRLMVGLGRSSYQKTIDVFVKYRLLRQSSGLRNMPVSVTLFASDAHNASTSTPDLPFYTITQRQTYTFQALVARKFNERLSLQLTPTVMHRNLAEKPLDANNVYALGMGGRYKLTKRTSFNAEYWYTPKRIGNTTQRDPQYTNTLSLGFDIETGGHVFQLHLTNSRGMIEKQFLGQTTGKWSNGDIFYGFNVARTFSFDKSKKRSNSNGY